MYESILIPLDGSELAEVALPYAEELAVRLGSEVNLLSVIESDETERYHEYLVYIQRMVDATKQGAERYLEKPYGGAIKVDSRILVGHPAEEIVDYADKADIDLIVMATHGRSGIRRWALGSVADKVARAAECPVVLIRARDTRPGVREKGILNRVIVPLDGSKQGEVVIPYIAELASKLKAEVIILQVIAGFAQLPYSDREMEPLKASAENYLEKVVNELKGKDIDTRFEIRLGDAAEEIIKLADEIGADVVAMSKHGRSRITRWVLGSVTSKVVLAGNTPLMLVKVPGASTE